MIRRNGACFRDRPAWFEVDNSCQLTFGEIRGSVDRLAAGLQRCGVEKGDRIGVLGKNSLEYFLLYGAAAAIGAVLLPINWRLSTEEALFNLNDCSPMLLFVDAEFQEMIQKVKERLPTIRQFYNLRPPGGGFLDFADLMENEGAFKPQDVSSDDDLVIIHTAAVAGRPRGAVLTHANTVCTGIHLSMGMQVTEADVHLSFLPLFHVAGLFMATQSFHAGAMNVNMSKFDALRAVELIVEKRVSLIFDFAPILSSILEQCKKTGKEIGTLRAVAGIDTADTIQAYQARTGGTFYCLYGQTETSGFATFGRFDDRPGSAGKMLPLTEVALVDEKGRLLSTGEIGEIAVKGPPVFKRYFNLPQETAYAFRDGWHHTGDLGRFDTDGYLWYEGRKAEKELIKPGGENVYPAEVERAIREHPSVRDAVVFGVPDPKWREGIKAVCRLKPGAGLEKESLIRFLAERIAGYKKPQQVQFVEDFPLLSDGSPDRARIKELYGGKQKD
jgi:long-chain acyl-CoA synthetase